ncbi:hypothetical protein QIT48_gp13 [Haloterrigena jeotgali icosahedral virus 1]|uniref:Uncharacterized protein n=2 Tax=root TaxID=1 RepID=A0AAF0PHG6_9EURY|nr:hypothetical protein [Natrinema thermotolerans]YP_010772651.1 hypothetical protein QIT48_gp13 [Haloterrigena jeotgali icosahedral virus 1]QCC57415.1 hypothetical protein DVR14_01675 [Natrinema thermotolerans]WMT10379.1 hypothetical protein NP511_22880 [Natrinema thermotolerans]WPH65824.1 hypothetical protein HJIV1_gp33 [Haloterrigena jeotgali icosahedral virus 1]DAC85291.1 TPA_asm: hypothetical protein HJIV1gp13 [Haloterrigena jeotgali icosahedral virus 1]
MGDALTRPDEVDSHNDHDATILEYLHAQAAAAERQAEALEDIRDLREANNERQAEFQEMLEALFTEVGAAPGVDFEDHV